MIDVISISECSVNFTKTRTNEQGYPEFTTDINSNAVTYLSTLAKHGKFSGIITKIGADMFGALALKTLSEYGINCSGIIATEKSHTSLAFTYKAKNGISNITPGADITLTIEEVNPKIINDAKIYHFTSNSLTLDPLCSTVLNYAKYAKENGLMISFSPNLNRGVWKSSEHAKEKIFLGFKKADFVTLTLDEIEFLYRTMPEKAAEIIMDDYNVKAVFIQLSHNESCFLTKSHCGYYTNKNYSNQEITLENTSIFSAGITYGLLKIGKDIDALSKDELERIISYASRTSSLYNSDNRIPDLQIF